MDRVGPGSGSVAGWGAVRGVLFDPSFDPWLDLLLDLLPGCGLGRDRASGVIDHRGRVFDGDVSAPETAVHEGLYVTDGSIVPRSLGVNPLFSITALTERMLMHFAESHQLRYDIEPRAA